MAGVSESSTPRLIVGLGNPGPAYAATRHNIGAMVCDELADAASPMPASFSAHKRTNSDIAQTRIDGHSVILAKPRSYMNVSGGPVAALCKYFKVAPADLIVIHDELDIDFGTVRLKRGGGEGGHNGLRSISQALGTKDYIRVRAGIGRPPGRMGVADFVLKPFAKSEIDDVPILMADSSDAVRLVLAKGLEAAQNAVH